MSSIRILKLHMFCKRKVEYHVNVNSKTSCMGEV